MRRYIDAEWIRNIYADFEHYENRDDWTTPITNVLAVIDDAPSIDIVRCGECIHNGSYDTDCPFGWRSGEWNMPKPCDYCSYGEREGE